LNSFFEIVQHSSQITLPVFVIVFLGWWLKRIGWIDAHFINISSKIVFNLALPALILIKILEVDLSQVFNLLQVGYGLLATLLGFYIVWLWGRRYKTHPAQRGVFVQGSFRGNLGIIGLALCLNMYGAKGLAIGSILLAFLTLEYNILSVFALTAPFQNNQSLDIKSLIKGIVSNPLIIAILSGLAMKWLGLHLPYVLFKSGEYFSSMTLPLALLCVGGSIDMKTLKQSSTLSIYATINKLVLLPSLFTLGAYFAGVRGIYLGTLFIMFASPAATVGFIMAKAMQGDAEMAANIIALSTAFSILSLSVGILILKVIGIA
jgi:predicted permease